MNSRVLLSGACALSLAAIAFLSPAGLTTASAKLQEKALQETKLETYERNILTVENSLVNAVKSFNESRTFDVYYGDIARLQEVFRGIAGLEVKEVVKSDPLNNFVDDGYLVEGDTPAAVRFSLVVDDLTSALKVIKKMELPVCEITWEAPNNLSIVVLTGGEV